MAFQRTHWAFLFLLLIAPQTPETKSVSGKITMEGGAAPLRFTIPLQSPGRPSISVAVNPQPDGTFRIALPIGMSIVGSPTGVPGLGVRSFTYGTTDLLAAPLVVNATDNAELLLTLRAPAPVSVSGRVVGLPSATGYLLVLMGTPLESSVRPDGSFTFNNVMPGTYQLRLISPILSQQLVPITVGSTSMTNVTITLPQERYVTGRVIVEGSNAQPPSVGAEARDVDGRVIKASTPPAYQGTNQGQFFLFRLRSGQYTIALRSIPVGYELKSLSYGTVDLLKQPLKLDGPASWDIVARLVPERR